jgi:APA family basic amino acid/polyamine antiporter
MCRPSRSSPAWRACSSSGSILYILVAVTAAGLAPESTLAKSDAPLTTAIRAAGLGTWAGDLLSLGSLIAITSVVLTVLYGQTRIIYSMARDGLLPRFLGALTPRGTPLWGTLVFGGLAAVLEALLPLAEIAKLVNIGTLFAFLVVNLGVIVLRRTQPELERPFRVPLVPVLPLIGAALCVYLMTRQPGVTWLRFVVWMALGLVVYALYGRRHSRVARGEGERSL